MKKLLILVSVLAMLLTGCSREWVNTNIDDYDTDRAGVGYAASQMPNLDDLGDYTDIKYTYQKESEFIFTCHGFALFVQYDADEYEQVKNDVLETYTFLEEPILTDYYTDSEDKEDYEIPLTEFDYEGYLISVVLDPYYSDGCKSLSMIGFDDDRCAVVHLYFCDQDLDYIAENDSDLNEEMKDFMDESFEWVEM